MATNFTLADSAETRDHVYRLRHDCYLRRGAIDPRPEGRFSDGYDALPNHFSFLMSTPEDPAHATVRISVVRPDLGWIKAPVREVFGDHPAFRPLSGDSFVEASRLCFSRQARREVLFELLAHMAALADFHDVGWLVACPREEHTLIYERLFGFRQLAEPRPYFGVKFRTALLAIRREDLRRNAQAVKWMKNAWEHAFARVASAQAAGIAHPVVVTC